MATATQVLQTAASQIGYVSAPGKVNPYNTAYYGYTCKGGPPAFCAAFVWWVFKQIGAQSLLHTKTAYVPTLLTAFKNAKQTVSSPQAGDIVYFNWNGSRSGGPQHVGIVERVISPSIVQTIEGNTSNANQSNGGCVQRKQRSVRYIIGYSRPAYSKPAVQPPSPAAKTVDYQVSVTADAGLNVRSAAGSTYPLSAPLLPKGTVVTVTKETSGWGFIGKGWISLMYTKKYIAPEPKPAPKPNVPAPKAWTVRISAKAGLNIRKQPSTTAKTDGTIPYNTKVSVIADKNGWLTLKDGRGFIFKRYTKKV